MTVPASAKPRISGWGAAVWLSVAAAFAPVFYRLATMGWANADYTHAYFLLPVFGWLVYRRRSVLAPADGLSKIGAILFGAGVALYIFSVINDFTFLGALSFVWVMWGVFALRFSKATVRALLFPLAYLLSLVPPPQLLIDTLTMPLKLISTQGSYGLMKLVRLPVEVHGAIIKVGAYELFVADACSGYRSIVTLLALGALYAHLQSTTTARKWVLFLAVVPIGLAANIFRIFLTGCIANFIGVKFAEGFFHELSGAVVFLLGVGGLMIFKHFLLRKPNVRR